MLTDKSMFRAMYPSRARVETADGKVRSIAMEGPADLQFCDKAGNVSSLHIPRALYAPDMANLLSVTDLVNEGHEVTFGARSRIDTDDDRCVTLRRHNKLFFMDYLPPSPSLLLHGGGARQSALFGGSTLAAASSALPATEWCARPAHGLPRDKP